MELLHLERDGAKGKTAGRYKAFRAVIQNLTEALASLRTIVTDLARILAVQSDLLHDADKQMAILNERM